MKEMMHCFLIITLKKNTCIPLKAKAKAQFLKIQSKGNQREIIHYFVVNLFGFHWKGLFEVFI